MKTMIEIRADLWRRAKARAAARGCTVSDLVREGCVSSFKLSGCRAAVIWLA
jgi:hypothetical protein